MDSPSEASPSTPKHLFVGESTVLDLHVDFSADRFGDFGRIEECQVVVDHAELPSDVTIEKMWLNLDRKVDIELPWEKEFGNRFLTTLSNPQVRTVHNF